jgi:hypothetical protein
MSEGFRPLGTYGMDPTGTCALCGTYGPLTRTHVPPRAAGNNQPSATMGTRQSEGLSRVQPGTFREGGTWKWCLCVSCNGAAGRFDEEFIRWWHMLVMTWPENEWPKPGETRTGCFKGGRPGAFVRSILAGMFAFNPTLRTRYPETAGAILSGDPVALPRELSLRLSLYRSNFRYVLGRMGIVVTSADMSSTSLNVEGEWVWPPFHIVLSDPSNAPSWQALDISAWTLETPTEVRDVHVRLHVLGESDTLMARFRNEAP